MSGIAFGRETRFQSSDTFSLANILVTCQTRLVAGAERCFVVNGGFTLVGNKNISWAVPIGLDLTSLMMQNGLLNDVYSQIVDVRFLHAITNSSSRPGERIAGAGKNNNNTIDSIQTQPQVADAAWPWVLLGCGFFAALTMSIMIAKRLKERRGYHKSTSGSAPRGNEAGVVSTSGSEEDTAHETLYLQGTHSTALAHTFTDQVLLTTSHITEGDENDEEDDDDDSSSEVSSQCRDSVSSRSESTDVDSYEKRKRHFV